MQAHQAGMGRLITLKDRATLDHILINIARGLANPAAFSLALPQGTSVSDHTSIKRIAACAGSGGSVLSKTGEAIKRTADCDPTPPTARRQKRDSVGNETKDREGQLWLTGEMSHHEALAATEQGTIVVCVGHSNSERGYLREVMQPHLNEELLKLSADQFEVRVSLEDEDPFQAVVLE